MIPTAYVAHALPDRVRVKIPERRGDQEYFAALAARVSSLERVRNVRVNADAASIVVETENAAAVTRRIASDKALFAIAPARERAPLARPSDVTASTDAPAVARRRPFVRAGDAPAAGPKLYEAVKRSSGRSAIENVAHAVATFGIRRDVLLASVFAGTAILQLATGDVLSSVLAVAFRAVDASGLRVS